MTKQKVSLQYTVDVEEIPSEMRRLLMLTFNAINEGNLGTEQVRLNIDDKPATDLIDSLEEHRKAIIDACGRLEDVIAIFQGYHKIKTNQWLDGLPRTEQEQQEETKDD